MTVIREGSSWGTALAVLDRDRVREYGPLVGDTIVRIDGNLIRQGDSWAGDVLANLDDDLVRTGQSSWGSVLCSIHDDLICKGEYFSQSSLFNIDGEASVIEKAALAVAALIVTGALATSSEDEDEDEASGHEGEETDEESSGSEAYENSEPSTTTSHGGGGCAGCVWIVIGAFILIIIAQQGINRHHTTSSAPPATNRPLPVPAPVQPSPPASTVVQHAPSNVSYLTPPEGSEQRGQILAVIKAPTETYLGQTVKIKISELRVSDEWAFVLGSAFQPNGKTPDYQKSPDFKANPKATQIGIDAGVLYGGVDALLRKQAGVWKIVTITFDAGDVHWTDYDKRFGAPHNLIADPIK